MSDILLGSETWEITATCTECGRTEIMYVPTDQEANDVRLFLIGRGWLPYSGSLWICNEHGDKP